MVRTTRKLVYGTKTQVWNGTADCTRGKLFKKHLMINKRGKVVSKKQHAQGKRNFKHLRMNGY